MLPAAARLRTAEQFSAVMRRGRRAGTPRLVVHLLAPGSIDGSSPPGPTAPSGPRAGFVVSGKIGNSVVRHRITRRLRPLVRRDLALLPAGSDLVIRALPAAATSSSAELDADLRVGLRSAARKAGIAWGAVVPPGRGSDAADSRRSVSGGGA